MREPSFTNVNTCMSSVAHATTRYSCIAQHTVRSSKELLTNCNCRKSYSANELAWRRLRDVFLYEHMHRSFHKQIGTAASVKGTHGNTRTECNGSARPLRIPQIKADSEGAGARSYNYRVVMYSGGAELDMRGRCSAGQRVLPASGALQSVALALHCRSWCWATYLTIAVLAVLQRDAGALACGHLSLRMSVKIPMTSHTASPRCAITGEGARSSG